MLFRSGYISGAANSVFGTALSSLAAMKLTAPVACIRAIEHMRELAPDVVFSTHWATNYYAEQLKDKPLTVTYCPDAKLYKLFEYRCDLTMISMPRGYETALRKKKYDEENLKLVPFLIRNEAFDIPLDKKQARRSLGLPEDNFTVVLAEGGYGIGKMGKICEMLIKERFPLTVIPVCGKNEELYEKLSSLKSTEEVTFMPYAFTEKILELTAASDVFCGKSGNMLAEATFFGSPSIVTHFANFIEKNIADHYINTVGCAIKEFSPERVVKLIKRFSSDDSALEPYRKAALDYHENFGSERAADVLWNRIVKSFPELERE